MSRSTDKTIRNLVYLASWMLTLLALLAINYYFLVWISQDYSSTAYTWSQYLIRPYYILSGWVFIIAVDVLYFVMLLRWMLVGRKSSNTKYTLLLP